MSSNYPELPSHLNVKSKENKKLRAAKDEKLSIDVPLSNVASTPKGGRGVVLPDVTKTLAEINRERRDGTIVKGKKPAPKASAPRAVKVTKEIAKEIEHKEARRAAAKKALDNVVKALDGTKIDLVKPGKLVIKKAEGRGTKPKLAKEPKAKVAKPKKVAKATKAAKPKKLVTGFTGKKGKLLAALSRKDGATMPQLLKACGWKSCRSTIGKIARAMGKEIVNEDGRYSIR